MHVQDIIVLAIVGLVLFLALRGCLRRRKRGGCCGTCAGCRQSGCPYGK